MGARECVFTSNVSKGPKAIQFIFIHKTGIFIAFCFVFKMKSLSIYNFLVPGP